MSYFAAYETPELLTYLLTCSGWVELGRLCLCRGSGWVGLGLYVNALGWVGLRKMDPRSAQFVH